MKYKYNNWNLFLLEVLNFGYIIIKSEDLVCKYGKFIWKIICIFLNIVKNNGWDRWFCVLFKGSGGFYEGKNREMIFWWKVVII